MKPHPLIKAARSPPLRVVRPESSDHKLGGALREAERVLDQYSSNSAPAASLCDGKPANGINRRFGGKEQAAYQWRARWAIRLAHAKGRLSFHVLSQGAQKPGIADYRAKQRLDLSGKNQPRRDIF
jgi:hypothetical protein